MKSELFFAGAIGLLVGGAIYWTALLSKQLIPNLLEGLTVIWVVFAIVLIVALAEMPLMLYSLRKIAQGTTPRWMALSMFGFYVAFAFFYAAVFELATGYETLGNWLAALGLARWASGVLIR